MIKLQLTGRTAICSLRLHIQGSWAVGFKEKRWLVERTENIMPKGDGGITNNPTHPPKTTSRTLGYFRFATPSWPGYWNAILAQSWPDYQEVKNTWLAPLLQLLTVPMRWMKSPWWFWYLWQWGTDAHRRKKSMKVSRELLFSFH